MKFWDSSALVPLIAREQSTETLVALFAADDDVLVSCITPLEMTSAMLRRARGSFDLRLLAERRLSVLEEQWTVIGEFDAVLADARLLVVRYGLRTGDAVQLASARFARAEHGPLEFVTSDQELVVAARAEGFAILP